VSVHLQVFIGKFNFKLFNFNIILIKYGEYHVIQLLGLDPTQVDPSQAYWRAQAEPFKRIRLGRGPHKTLFCNVGERSIVPV
jgi:hypothetical protein